MSKAEVPADYSRPASCILHPTDFSAQSDQALAHALRLALTNQANLELLHVGKDTDEEWEEFPSIRGVLERWGTIPKGSSRSAVNDLGIGIRKVIAVEKDVASSIEGYCELHPVDMIVMATAGRDGLAAWLRPSQAERVAERVSSLSIPTLFVPSETNGCVSAATGDVTMKHVLVPVDKQPESEAAVERALRAIAHYGDDQADLTLLHVGDEAGFPDVNVSEGPWNIRREVRSGNPAAEIIAAANDLPANLVVMVTEGTHGLLDVVRGTTTEQVLRHAPCPLLAVPA